MAAYGQFARSSNQSFSKFGAGVFAKSYAHGGITSKMFPVEGVNLERTPVFRRGVRTWSPAYMRNLERMQTHGGEIGESASKLLKNAPESAGQRMLGKRLAGGVFGGALAVGLPTLLTEGGVGERAAAAAGGVGGVVGWEAGWAGGAAAGGAIGSAVPFIGTAAGALIGAVAGAFGGSYLGYEGFEKGIRNTIGAVAERGKRTRTSNWVQDTSAFSTRKAKTMRQASLQMMNSGMMTARSALGHEGTQLHS